MTESSPDGAADVAHHGRRRFRFLLRVLPLLAIGAIAFWYMRTAPHETTLIWVLGPKGQGLVELEVEVLRLPDKALMRKMEYHYTSHASAPERESSRVRLAAGQYQAQITLHYADHLDQQTRVFQFTDESALEIRL